MAYGSNYYEADQEVNRTTSPYSDSYTPGYVNPVYPRRHQNGMSTIVTEIVKKQEIPSARLYEPYAYGQQEIPSARLYDPYAYGHSDHHHVRPTVIVEKEERIIENVPYGGYGSYRTPPPMY